MSFTKVNAAGIGTTQPLTLSGANLSGVITASGLYVTGISTFTGNVSIGGTLTYEDTTNVDSIGLITARSGIQITGGSGLDLTGSSGIITATTYKVGAAVTISSGGVEVAGVTTTQTLRVGTAVTISSGGIHVLSGITTVSAGTTSAPSITPLGDNNTGIFFPSADTIAFAEGGVEAARFDSSGRFGLGTNAPGSLLTLNAASNPALRIDVSNTRHASLTADTSSTATFLESYENYPLAFSVSSGGGRTERARIDTSGRLLVGTSTARTNFFNGADSSQLQLEGTSTSTASLAIIRNSDNIGYPILNLAKARGASVGSITIVQNNDYVGGIEFQGSDGTDFVQAASITAQVDGTPGANDMPGRLVFSTTLDGASSPTERMRITNNGRVMIGTTTDPGYQTSIIGFNSYACLIRQDTGNSTYPCLDLFSNFGTGNNIFTQFYDASGLRGSITFNRSGGVVAYNTTSDYRAKTLLGEVEDPGQTIDALKVYRGVMNGATVERPMLVAHEAQEVAPYSVTGEKDAVDEEGNPVYQQMDHQVLVPLLIAEIQQLRARVAALEAS
jgi:hypothetical protein